MKIKIDKSRVKTLKTLERVIGYRFRNKFLLNEALTHKSYANENSYLNVPHNERLEFLGDAVLGLVISKILYFDYPNQDEGVLTQYRAQLVSGDTLSKLAKELNIGDFILFGKGEGTSGGRRQLSNMLCTLESIIGAIYLDGDLKPVFKFIMKIFKEELQRVKEGKGIKDYKSMLQQVILKRFKTIPSYKMISELGPEHKKHFIIEVVIHDKRYGVGSGPNKKTAEQLAAKEALLQCQ